MYKIPPLYKGRLGGVKGNMTKVYNQKSQTAKRKKLRKNLQLPEILLWSILKSKKLGYKFRRQYSVGKYVIDFYCVELKLAIEVDGDSHFLDAKTERCDSGRQKFIELYGITFLRIMNYEILGDLGGVQITIECKIKELKKRKIFANIPPPTPPCKGGEFTNSSPL
jgi:very-short-patch-repair endonuclease